MNSFFSTNGVDVDFSTFGFGIIGSFRRIPERKEYNRTLAVVGPRLH